MMPYCHKAFITKVHTTVGCDTYFPNLDEDPAWAMTRILESGEENGIKFDICVYERV
jgi:dihydrofolate reductase